MSKQFEYENIGKQSTNMSEIMVYLAMFSTIIDKNSKKSQVPEGIKD